MNPTLLKAGFGLVLITLSTAGAFAQVSNFDSLNGYAAGVDTRLALSRSMLLRGTPADASSNLFVTGTYLSRDVDAASDSMERSTDASSFTLGYNWKLPTWTVGVGVVSESTSSDYVELNSPAPQPLRGSVDGDSIKGVVWTGFKLGPVDVSLFGFSGTTDNDGIRRSDAGTSRATFGSRDLSVGFRLSYATQFGEAVNFEPFVGMNFSSAKNDGFAEQGTAPDRRILRDFTMRDDRFALGATVAGSGAGWVPSATIAWLQRTSESGTTIPNTASNGSNLGLGLAPAASRGLFYISAAFRGKLSDHWAMDGSVDFATGGDEQQVSLNLSVRRLF